MSKSNFAENAVLNHRYGGPDYARPATVYIALFTSAPNDAGGGTEVAGGSYARAAVTNDATNFPAAVGGSKSNAVAVPFAQATAVWGTLTHGAIFDALVGGNLLDWGALGTPRTINTGDQFILGVGDIQISED